MSYFHKFVEFSKAMFTVLPKMIALAPTNRRFAEKNRLNRNTDPNPKSNPNPNSKSNPNHNDNLKNIKSKWSNERSLFALILFVGVT